MSELDPEARSRALRRAQRQARIFTALTIVLAIIGISAICYPFVLQTIDSFQQASRSQQINQQVSHWPTAQVRAALQAARDYNAQLAQQGQAVIGENVDPFTSQAGQSTIKPDEDLASSKDATYMSLLNESYDGIMGSVEIPKISLNLPIYHGTGTNALNRGAGHLYGTSLPVGGKNTHTVLSGHRGMVEALMFTRIDELQSGDNVYLHVLGTTLGYQIDSIRVILPTEGEQYLRVVPGQDRITLLTCTPYGVNTHRLLVSGHRVTIPSQAPYPQDAQQDMRMILVRIALLTVLGAAITCLIVRSLMRRKPRRSGTVQRMHHVQEC